MEKEECLPHCPCDSPNWKSQTISLTAVEEVEISGFDGKDHDFDLLEMILMSAPIPFSLATSFHSPFDLSPRSCHRQRSPSLPAHRPTRFPVRRDPGYDSDAGSKLE
jgi:hypothetical protein